MILVIDTETTGLGEDDEIIQLSIIDSHGNELLNRYYKPEHHTEWPEAQAVNGISPDDVKDFAAIQKDIGTIQLLIDSASAIVGYNTRFDIGMLTRAGIHVPNRVEVIDVMREFSPIYGEWNDDHSAYKWQKLTTCAEYYGYKFHAHDSMEDVKATLFCWKKVQKDQEQERRERERIE